MLCIYADFYFIMFCNRLRYLVKLRTCKPASVIVLVACVLCASGVVYSVCVCASVACVLCASGVVYSVCVCASVACVLCASGVVYSVCVSSVCVVCEWCCV